MANITDITNAAYDVYTFVLFSGILFYHNKIKKFKMFFLSQRTIQNLYLVRGGAVFRESNSKYIVTLRNSDVVDGAISVVTEQNRSCLFCEVVYCV